MKEQAVTEHEVRAKLIHAGYKLDMQLKGLNIVDCPNIKELVEFISSTGYMGSWSASGIKKGKGTNGADNNL